MESCEHVDGSWRTRRSGELSARSLLTERLATTSDNILAA